MKIAGIVLLILQVLALVGGGIPAGANIAYYIGYFLPGILGVFLLIKGSNKKG